MSIRAMGIVRGSWNLRFLQVSGSRKQDEEVQADAAVGDLGDLLVASSRAVSYCLSLGQLMCRACESAPAGSHHPLQLPFRLRWSEIQEMTVVSALTTEAGPSTRAFRRARHAVDICGVIWHTICQ